MFLQKKLFGISTGLISLLLLGSRSPTIKPETPRENLFRKHPSFGLPEQTGSLISVSGPENFRKALGTTKTFKSWLVKFRGPAPNGFTPLRNQGFNSPALSRETNG